MNWSYIWRRYFGWFPIQACYVCGAWYWGGIPWWSLSDGHWQWMPCWMEYCSRECCDAELECCEAYSAAVGQQEEPRCEHCGKAFEDCSDLGCGHCDARHPEFGLR